MTKRHSDNQQKVADDDPTVVIENDSSFSPSSGDWIKEKEKSKILSERYASIINQAARTSKENKEFSILAFHKICLSNEYMKKGIKILEESLGL